MQVMQKKVPVSTASRLKCGWEYPTIKVLPHNEKCKKGMLPQMNGRNCARVTSTRQAKPVLCPPGISGFKKGHSKAGSFFLIDSIRAGTSLTALALRALHHAG